MAVNSQSERTILLGTVLIASAVSGATGFVLAQYYSVDVLSSIFYPPQDCWLGRPTNVGRHCFNDYTILTGIGMRPDPWKPFPIMVFGHTALIRTSYTAAAMVPIMIFAFLGKWLDSARLGLFGYLIVLTIAVVAPAIWASRGARGLERIVVFLVCGTLAVPAWFAIDRGNSVGFVVPIALAFLVALRRERWGLVAITVVLAALVKPQFAVLGFALLAARQWRLSSLALLGGVVTNVGAYLLWPRNFPSTIVQNAHNNLDYSDPSEVLGLYNVSFGKALLLIPDTIAAMSNGGKLPEDFLATPRSLIGFAILVLVVICTVVLGRRIPPVMVGIALLATASLFPALSNPYYLVFALPIAALVVRDPGGAPGTGLFDQFTTVGSRRRIVGVSVSLAAALSIAAPIAAPGGAATSIAIGGEPGVIGLVDTTRVVPTSVILSPILWLIACAAIIVSYARMPDSKDVPTASLSENTAPATASPEGDGG
ncbi:glycosyltransferase family 87 protein [Mycobacterium asiaticum]|uniref:glycosyltransferase family 87 protein n=1 Tax=Mycobacterium asiaticum TaxID=1790 RepID=UPI000AD3A4FF|nr:glycosyltransferase family 87 protein [Mycobacterium asiaticum]